MPDAGTPRGPEFDSLSPKSLTRGPVWNLEYGGRSHYGIDNKMGQMSQYSDTGDNHESEGMNR